MIIEDYLNNMGEGSPYPLSFSTIAWQFINDNPERANFFCCDQTARSALDLLDRTAVLMERFFPKLDFESYLTLCINKECYFLKVCNVLRDNYPNNKHDVLESLTDIICLALATYDKETHTEIRIKYLSDAEVAFERLKKVNVAQSNKAKKDRPNPFKDLILEIVKENPKISCDNLAKELRKDKYGDVIDNIDETSISYYQDDKQIKVVATSGLKDRLTKAKKILNQKISLTG